MGPTDFGLYLLNSTTVITNNTIVGQSAEPFGTGIFASWTAKTWIRNNIISGNYYAMHLQSSSEKRALITQNLISRNVNSIYAEAPAVAL